MSSSPVFEGRHANFMQRSARWTPADLRRRRDRFAHCARQTSMISSCLARNSSVWRFASSQKMRAGNALGGSITHTRSRSSALRPATVITREEAARRSGRQRRRDQPAEQHADEEVKAWQIEAARNSDPSRTKSRRDGTCRLSVSPLTAQVEAVAGPISFRVT